MIFDSRFIGDAGSTGLAFFLEAALKGTLLLALGALLALAFRRGSAAHRHLVWACALAGLVALPVMLATVPAWRVTAPALAWLSQTPVPAPADEAPPTSPAAEEEAATEQASPAPESPSTPAPAAGSAAPTPSPAPAVAANPTPRARISWAAVALTVWAIGAVAVFATFVAGHVILRLMLRGVRPIRDGEWHALAIEAADRLGLTLPFALLRGEGVLVPVALGMVRPRVLLPAGCDAWPVELRRAILLHELAHVQRHDCLTQAVAQLACALFWFHPAVWWAASRLQAEREQACDDRVLAAQTRATDYADQLLAMVRSLRATRLAALGAVAFARRSSLEGRLLAVLDPDRDRRAVGRRVAAPAALAAALLVLPFAALKPVVAGNARGEWKRTVREATNPNDLRPSRVVAVPEPEQSLDARAAWARGDAGRSGERVWWIGWIIEPGAHLKGSLLSDTEGIHVNLLGRRGAFTLEDVLAGRERGTGPAERSSESTRPAAVLVRLTAGVPDRVRVQSLELPVEFWGEPLYWMAATADEQSFAWLRKAADDARTERMRGQFVESIGFMGRSELVAPYLMTTFRTTNSPEVKARAAEALAHHPSPEAVRLLADAARTDRSSKVRRVSVEALGHFQTPDALEALLAIARAGDGEGERRAAFEALGEKVSDQAPENGRHKGDESGEAVVPADEEVSADELEARAEEARRAKASKHEKEESNRVSGPPDERSQPMPAGELEIQSQAIEALGRYPEEQSLQRLKRIAETSPNSQLRVQAVESLGRLGTPAALSVVEQVVWRNRHSQARTMAVETMGRRFPADPAVTKLTNIARSHPSRETRRMAVEMIGRVDGPRAREALDRIVTDGVDADVQRQAVESLGRRAEDVERRLGEIARTHPSVEVRRQAVESLGRREGSTVGNQLMEIARAHPSVEVRRQAVESLGRREGSTVADQLMEIARGDVPVEVQRQATESLGRLVDPRARAMLLELARSHPSIEVERQAVESLGRLEADVMTDLAQIARSHRSSEVRRQAVESMTRRDPDKALPFLEEILRQPARKGET